MTTKKLVCFLSGSPGNWEAICLSLNIAVQGETREEVESELNAAILDYLNTAESEAPAVRDALINRHAPIPVYVKYWSRFMWAALAKRRGGGPDDRTEATLIMPCPA